MKTMKHISLYLLTAAVVIITAALSAFAAETERYSVSSPDGSVIFDMEMGKSSLEYSVTDDDGYVWIDKSPIEFTIDRVRYFTCIPTAVETAEMTDSYSHIGNFSHADDKYTLARFTFDMDGYSYYLYAAVFDDGVALRYVFPDTGSEREKVTDHTAFRMSDVRELWYGVNNTSCEGEITAHDPSVLSRDEIFLPLTAVKEDGRYVAIMEADVSSSMGGATLECRGNGLIRLGFMSVETRMGELKTPWRVVSLAEDLNELVNNDNIYTLCAPCDEELYGDEDWIVPGRAVWSWGVNQGSPSPEQMIEYTEYASKLGFEYNIIDDGWPRWDDYRVELKRIGEYGNGKNVRQIIWCAVNEGTPGINKIDSVSTVDDFIGMMKDCELDGAKIDFWQSEDKAETGKMQSYFLEKCAESQLVVDLHGCSKNSGTNRTYPNELTREGLRGLEHIGASCRTRDNEKYAELLTAQLFTRYLCGHGDWTPTVDSAMEIASVICIDSPLMSIASDPADILGSEACEFIKSIPTVWDRTVVLSPSEIGKRAVFAKEVAGSWFVGGIYSEESDDVSIDLGEFLPEGVAFFADIWDDSDGKTLHTRKVVDSSDTLVLSKKTKGTGFAVRLSPIELSSYGGEIRGDVTLSCADEAAEILYTVDGSDPLVSASSRTYSKPIKLSEPCTLTVGVKLPDGYASSVRCRFNPIADEKENAEEKNTAFEIWKKLIVPKRLRVGRSIY